MCKLCETKPVYEFTNKRKVCKTCYIRWFNKKFLYVLRKFSMITRDSEIVLPQGDDFRSSVLRNLLKTYAEKYSIKISDSCRKNAKIAIPDSADAIAKKITNEIIQGNADNLKKFFPVYKNKIRPLFLFLDKEIILYARLAGIGFADNPHKDSSNTGDLIDELEKKHPEIKWAIVNDFIRIFKEKSPAKSF